MKKIKELEECDEENDKIIISLKAEMLKLKDNDLSLNVNRPSLYRSSFGVKNNLKKQLQINSEFPSIFNNPRISTMVSRMKPSIYRNFEEFSMKPSIMNIKRDESVMKPSLMNISEEKIVKPDLLKENNDETIKKIMNFAEIEYPYFHFDEARFF